MLALLMVLVGCTPPETNGRTETDPESGPETDTDTTGDTAPPDSGTTPERACAELPPPGPFAFASIPIETQEDFDFDTSGFLLTQRDNTLQGVSQTGETHIAASNVGPDATGLRSLSTGDVVVAQPSTGALHLVNQATGGSIAFLGGLVFPNGLEATRDGRVFASETSPTGRILLIDPYGDEVVIVGQLDSPNNMALSQDEQVLYVMLMAPSDANASRIVAYDRDPSGSWEDRTPRLVYAHDTYFGGMTTDMCGNVYVVEYVGGRVFRIRAGEQEPELVASLPGGGSWSSLRFSPGYGDWTRQQLYATNRSRLFLIEVGVDGRHVLASGR